MYFIPRRRCIGFCLVCPILYVYSFYTVHFKDVCGMRWNPNHPLPYGHLIPLESYFFTAVTDENFIGSCLTLSLSRCTRTPVLTRMRQPVFNQKDEAIFPLFIRQHLFLITDQENPSRSRINVHHPLTFSRLISHGLAGCRDDAGDIEVSINCENIHVHVIISSIRLAISIQSFISWNSWKFDRDNTERYLPFLCD